MPADEQEARSAHERIQRNTRTIAYLALSVALMLVAGLTVGIFLLVRGNDIQNVQDEIETRVGQTERAFCAYMEQRSLITVTPEDKLLANQAEILIRRFGCEVKGSLQSPVTTKP